MKYYLDKYSMFTCRSSQRRCSIKKGILKNFAKFTEEHLCRSLFFNFFKKEILTQVFSCESYEIFKNTFFTEHFRVSASVVGFKTIISLLGRHYQQTQGAAMWLTW